MARNCKPKSEKAKNPKYTSWGRDRQLFNEKSKESPPSVDLHLHLLDSFAKGDVLLHPVLSLLDNGEEPDLTQLIALCMRDDISEADAQADIRNFNKKLSAIPEHRLSGAYFLPAANFDGPPSPHGYSARLISRNADENIVERIENELEVCHVRHGDALEALSRDSEHIYKLLMRGFPAEALSEAAETGSAFLASVLPTVEDHTMLLSIATAHLRVGLLTNLTRHPMGVGWGSPNKFPTQRSVAETALIAPAKKLYKLYQLDFDEVASDEDALEKCFKEGVLSRDLPTGNLIKYAREIREKAPDHQLTRDNMKHLGEVITKRLQGWLDLDPKNFNGQNLTRRTFAEDRIGATASQGTVIIALNLLLQRGRIKACCKAVLDGQPLPERHRRYEALPKGKQASLRRLTEAFRVSSQCDSNVAAEIAPKENGNSKELAQKTRKRLEAGQLSDAIGRLVIDPGVYFARHSNG